MELKDEEVASLIFIEEVMALNDMSDELIVETDMQIGSTKGGANQNLSVWKHLLRRAHRELGI